MTSVAYHFGREISGLFRGLVSSPRATLRANGEADPVLQLNEIQGNVLIGFNKERQLLVFLKFHDARAARSWIRETIPFVATAEEVVAFKRLYKAIRARRGVNDGTVWSTWTNVAFSSTGLRKVAPDATAIVDPGFQSGAATRTAVLGDTTGSGSLVTPSGWVVGGAGREPDAVVIIASDSDDGLDRARHRLEARLGPGVGVIHVERGNAPPDPFSAHEHFGYRDGVSQPGIRGRLSDEPGDFLTPRENPLDPNEGKPGQRLIWPGEFVFGYPQQDREDPLRPGPVSSGGPGWTRNGSFLVFRRYSQDVGGFRRFLDSTARELAHRVPGLTGVTPGQIAAKLVGRWFSGTPLARAPDADNSEIPKDSCADNHFDFLQPARPLPPAGPGQCGGDRFPPAVADPLGLACPFAAHIRRAYPRDDLGKSNRAQVERHRMLRRGIPFGKPYPADGERGLLFLAYMTSIERQFEFVVREWLNNPDFRTRGSGHDPIVGQSQRGPRTFAIPYRDDRGNVHSITLDLPNWITVTGGGYYFSPSISALKHLARDGKA